MTVEEKNKTIKLLYSLAEESKISIRNIRKKFRNKLSKSNCKKLDKEIQEIIDKGINRINIELLNKINKFQS